MTPHKAFLAHAREIERAIRMVSARFRLRGADLEDFRQEARCFILVHAEEVFGRFAGRAALDSYLFTIIRHLVGVNDRRPERRRASRVLGLDSQARLSIGHRSTEHCDEQLSSHDAAVLAARLSRTLACAFRELPPGARLLIYRRYRLGESFATLAAAHRTTIKAIYGRCDRALAALRRHAERAGFSAADIQYVLDAMANDVVDPNGWMDG